MSPCGMLMFAGATTSAGHGYSLCLSPTAGRFPVPRAPLRSGDVLKKPLDLPALSQIGTYSQSIVSNEKFIEQPGNGRSLLLHPRQLSPRAMTPTNAIAECERPQKFSHAVEGSGVIARSVSDCYESFTLSSLFARDVVATFARVMTEALTNISRGAGAAVRVLRGNHRPLPFSAHNVLFLTPTSDLRPPNSDIS